MFLWRSHIFLFHMENYWDVVWPVPESALAYVARNEAVTFSFSVSFFFPLDSTVTVKFEPLISYKLLKFLIIRPILVALK